MHGYYQEKLGGERLRRCYDLAPERVRRYLEAETDFVARVLAADHLVLDLGCGYGRELPRLAAARRFVVGIDSSAESLRLGRCLLADVPDCLLACMDATDLALVDGSFDTVVCLQNGVSAFHVDLSLLIGEAALVCRPGGSVLFFTYSESFRDHRLERLQRQADAGLVGPVDYERTADGTIVCFDWFTATAVVEGQVRAALQAAWLDECVDVEVREVDASSLFYILRPVG